MIKSMTGMGTAECYIGEELVTIEMKTVNHRFCDVTVKGPKTLSQLDIKINKKIKGNFTRGKIDVFIRIGSGNGNNNFNVNTELARKYYDAVVELKKALGLRGKVRLSHIIRNQDVFRVRETFQDIDEIWGTIEKGLDNCIKAVASMRSIEGKEIERHLRNGIENLKTLTGKVENLSSEVKGSIFEKLRTRISELVEKEGEIDQQRIVQEAAYLADRMDISEEVNRLIGHCDHFNKLLDFDEPIGRKLDFLAQEMNREGNTIASKCSDLRISRLAVEVKSEIEKIREQVQNVE